MRLLSRWLGRRRTVDPTLPPQVIQADGGFRIAVVRLAALALGVVSLIGSSLLILLGLRFGMFLLLFGLSQIGLAVFFTPRVSARNRLKRKTDVSRFASERDPRDR